MTGITTQEMSDAARELREAIAEHDRLCVLIGGRPMKVDGDGEILDRGEPGLEAAYKQTWLKAHAASTTYHPDRRVKEHEVAADEAAFEDWARLTAAQYGLKACKERMHSLRQVLSSYQTQARIEGDLGGSIPDAPFGARRAS